MTNHRAISFSSFLLRPQSPPSYPSLPNNWASALLEWASFLQVQNWSRNSFEIFSFCSDLNASKYSSALWRNGWQTSCRLARRLSTATTNSFPSCTPLVRFLCHQIYLWPHVYLHICRPFLLQYPIGVFYQWRFHCSLWMFSTSITTKGVTCIKEPRQFFILLQICNTEEEKGKILDFLKPGCSQQCDVTCQNLGATEAKEVGQITC